jgi:hypothetical protein
MDGPPSRMKCSRMALSTVLQWWRVGGIVMQVCMCVCEREGDAKKGAKTETILKRKQKGKGEKGGLNIVPSMYAQDRCNIIDCGMESIEV